jgi:DNA-binding HxlR family transcriptional regulator
MGQDFDLDASLDERFGKCPYSTVQSLISGKWAMLILYYLMDEPVRFNELQRRMPKMTNATLSVQLKSLMEKGLVERKQYESIPPVVEYSLTDIGKKFQPVLEAMKNWGIEYIDCMKDSSNK